MPDFYYRLVVHSLRQAAEGSFGDKSPNLNWFGQNSECNRGMTVECHNTKIGEIVPGVPPNGAKLFFRTRLRIQSQNFWRRKSFYGLAKHSKDVPFWWVLTGDVDLVDLSLYLLPAAETVDTQSIKYCGACQMWIKCMSRQSLYVIFCSTSSHINAAHLAPIDRFMMTRAAAFVIILQRLDSWPVGYHALFKPILQRVPRSTASRLVPT